MIALEKALASVRSHLGEAWQPGVALVVGTGLDAVIDCLTVKMELSYSDIEGFPDSTAPGHQGRLLVAQYGVVELVVFQGRFHLYEGWSPSQAAMPSYLAQQLGARAIIFTNAVGALNPEWQERDLAVIEDHINFTGQSPLVGTNNDALGPRFPDMSQLYNKSLREIVDQAAAGLGFPLRKGIYGGVLGPELETSAERRFFRMAGADVVGMSLVMEVIAANHCGLKVLALSAITNAATGLEDQQPDSIESVLENAAVAGGKLAVLIRDVIRRIGQMPLN